MVGLKILIVKIQSTIESNKRVLITKAIAKSDWSRFKTIVP